MYVGFPHLGNSYLGLKALFSTLDIPAVSLPPVNRETVHRGVQYSPEFSCFPFKTVLGNYVQALEKGADVLVMLGGGGPCRFGYFGNLQERILKDLGYNFKMVIIEPLDWGKTLRHLNAIFPTKSWKQLLFAANLAWSKQSAADKIERLSLIYRGRQKLPGTITRIYQNGLAKIDCASSPEAAKKISLEVEEEMKSAAHSEREDSLKIALLGDIYTIIEPYSNYDTGIRLGELGVELERSMYCSDWLFEQLPWKKRRKTRKMLKLAQGYLHDLVGGHGLNTVANTVDYARRGFDGVIQLLPLTCMPEIIAQSILPRVAEDYQTPVLSLTLDEHSSGTGLQTRLEAFIDLIRDRKAKQKN